MADTITWGMVGLIGVILIERVIMIWTDAKTKQTKLLSPPAQMVPINVMDSALNHVANAIVVLASKWIPDSIERKLGLKPQHDEEIPLDETVPGAPNPLQGELEGLRTLCDAKNNDLNDLQAKLNKSAEFVIAKGDKAEYEQFMKD